ncbi:MAG: DNA-binding response regulator [Candidatus Lambdaproteobacteria bacterium RIFOXYD2_FULL_50_16]|uniref:DNA-binding response regulator n=1 Tax=Candidatus Lambdaproteobacteria bacterium RIFOXYD2_FULL_50_16 TaxID=1817772 RepID=A0A1F6G7F7_9PROT|nr:MAG: DNA-binding response regulator [Candidatus Lambdaproteobacteria bacterium RIFOXYD2_FULL_50_16]
MSHRILIIDDDEKLVGLLNEYLTGFGYLVESCIDPRQGLEKLGQNPPELVILDVMMPHIDGFEVLKRIRANSDLPVIMLTARGDLTDRVVGLEIGADDYLSKPFEPRELAARIQTVLRRSNLARSPIDQLDFGPLHLNLKSHQVTLAGQKLDLTSTEFELLRLFAQHPGEVLSRDLILEKVAGIEWESYNRSIDVLVSRLRHKLDDDPKHPRFLKTVWGSGYLFLGGQDD